MEESEMEEYANRVHATVWNFVQSHDLDTTDMKKLEEFFRTCDDDVFSLPHETIIRRAYTYIRRKD